MAKFHPGGFKKFLDLYFYGKKLILEFSLAELRGRGNNLDLFLFLLSWSLGIALNELFSMGKVEIALWYASWR